MKTADELRTFLEREFRTFPGVGNSHQSPTGESYDAIGITEGGENVGCVVPEGCTWALYDTPGEAVNNAKTAFAIYSIAKYLMSPTLYWRQPPVLEEHNGKYRVYMRGLLSNQPVLSTAA